MFRLLNSVKLSIPNPVLSCSSCPIFFRVNRMGLRPLDSAVAPLGVTEQLAVIPTGATNAVRSGTEESQEHIDLFILSTLTPGLQPGAKT